MSIKKLLFLSLLVAAPVFGQGMRYDNFVLKPLAAGGVTPVSGALITVCTSAGTGTPCTPKVANIYSDEALTIPITGTGGAGTTNSDANGNFGFYAAPGSYIITVTGSGITSYTIKAILPFGGSADAFFKSGRPWFDVMAFGAKNDGSTDDTAAVGAAISAACAAGANGPTGIVYFPPAKTTSGLYFFSGTTSPIVLSCDGLALVGAGVPNQAINSADNFSSKLYAPNLVNTAIVTTSGGTRYGILIHGLGFQGHGASPAGIQGINVTMNGIIEYSGFNNLGSSAIVTNSAANAQVILTKNVAIGCLMGGASVDTGCYDLGGNDVIAEGNYAQVGVSGLGNIGTGHRFAWVIRGCCGAYTDNFGELSEQGWELVSGANYNRLVNNRSVLNQGAGFINQGIGSIFTSNISISNSQTANNNSPGFNSTGTGQSGIFQSNMCVDNGTGVLVSNCFNDSNNNSGQASENQYDNNRAQSNAVAGVLYNFTGTAPYRVSQPSESSTDRGDTSPTVQCWIDADTQYFNTALTANRTVTLSTTGAWNGCKFRVIRTVNATGAFTLTVNSLALYPGNDADFEFIAGAWKTVGPNDALLVASGTKALNTASVTTATCDAGAAVTANGTLSTDVVDWSFNAAPTATNKYGAFLVVYAVPSANTVTFYTCNPSATTSTPTAMTVNWSVRRP